MTKLPFIASLGLAFSCAAFVSQTALAFAPYLGQFSDYYESNGIDVGTLVGAQSCGTCHVRAAGGGQRNAYGNDFQKITLGEGKGFSGLEFIDSDADGFNSLEEIFAQTAPGKNESKPAGRVDLAIASGELSFTVPSKCGTLTLKAFGFQFDGKSDTEVTNVIDKGTVKISGDKGAVLALCKTEAFAGSLRKE